MHQRLSVITLAADDLTALRNFYSLKIGWEPVAGNQDIVFYKLNGFLLSICKKKDLASFIGTSHNGNGFRSFTLGYNVPTKEEVDQLYERLRTNGVSIVKEPTETSFGAYFFYFSDPENNILEIAYNPFIPMDADGNALTHLPVDHL